MDVHFINTSPLGEDEPQEKRLFISDGQECIIEEPKEPPRPAVMID